MKNITKNKAWNIVEDYNLDKLLYLLTDRPDEINPSNEILWKNNKEQIHREYDLPAMVWRNGHISWWKNNKRHRENNKPAIIYANGCKEYLS